MRLLCAAAVSLSLGVIVTLAGDDKPARAERLNALKKKFDAEMGDLTKQMDRATTQAQARAVQTEMRELVAIRMDKALAIAKEDPKDEVGLAAAEFIVTTAAQVGGGDLKEVGAAVELITEHHAANPKVKDVLVPAMSLGKAGDKLLEAVSEKATDKDAKGLALFVRGFKASRMAEDEEDEKGLAAAVAKATDLLEQAAKLAPGQKVSTSNKTVADLAKRDIEGLKSLKVVTIGKPGPDVESLTLDGKKTKLSDHRGKVVLLDMWATWCGPCRAMIPHERQMAEKFKGRPFSLISVSADDDKETLTNFLAREPMPWTHWWDDGNESRVFKAYRAAGLPTLYLIDHTGVVRKKWEGVPGGDPKSDILDKAIEELLKDAEKAKG